MKAAKVQEVMPKIFSILRTHIITRHFSLRQVYILNRIIYLALIHGVNSPGRRIYCVPSEKYLAKATYSARETVSRNISLLRQFGMLEVIQRRPEKGRWSTNLYKFGKLLWALVKDVTSCFCSVLNRVTLTSHIVPETSNISHTNRIGTRIPIKLKVKEGEDAYYKAILDRRVASGDAI